MYDDGAECECNDDDDDDDDNDDEEEEGQQGAPTRSLAEHRPAHQQSASPNH